MTYEKVLIMAKDKELSNSQKALIVKLCKDGESKRNISSNLNIPFTVISSFITRFKNVTQLKTKRIQVLQGRFPLDYQENSDD